MTAIAARVRDAAVHRLECPRIFAVPEGERDHSVLVIDEDFTVRLTRADAVELRAPRANGELADAGSWIASSYGVLRREALVQVIVPRHDHIDAVGVHDVPYLLHLIVIAMRARAEAGMMEVGDGTPG